MTDNVSLLRAAAHPMNTDGVTATVPTLQYSAEKCEFPLHIGLFFDGTGNNQDWAGPDYAGGTQLQRMKDSNVARLFRAYPNARLRGYYPRYIPGVGTPFADIGEDIARDMLGMGFGAGGESRVVFGLLHVLNSMRSSLDNGDIPMVQPEAVKALCSNCWLPLQTGTGENDNPLSLSDQFVLDEVGMKDRGGLLMMNGFTYRTQFLKTQFSQLAQKISETSHPKPVEVFIDVFGFSRGAAQARVFCNWLDECFEGNTLAGVTAHIRFLGIFDTVAAVGLGPAAGRWANGHNGWGEPENLRISQRVRHCEHYVAMHEQRDSFPLEDVQTPGDAMPPNCRQFRFPGMHSDLGGAYLPNEQGKNGGADNSKLSQISLNMMYEAARAARVPVDIEIATETTERWSPFAVSEKLLSDYHSFIKANGSATRQIADCLIDILAWRFRFRDSYGTLPFVQRATQTEQSDLLGAHNVFLKDIREIEDAEHRVYYAREGVATSKLSLSGQIFRQSAAENHLTQAHEAHASIPRDRRHIYELVRTRKLSPVELDFFSEYCHDSFAGFKPFDNWPGRALSRNAPWESGGYLKFRTRYAGESLRLALLKSISEASSAEV
ncbi:hypothetical protein R69608_06555 [Paraburkholderia nemoris]|uniref:T6SS phospholipase effector Tle1-like catalytic domain-containing protein n=1 Tax=Paraburkholderia nemoris TaxID=2793076 RepID=UPI001912C511|nr:DUF2235 domain-containing protein [Paraburkholderia nemoris]MBK5152113.1 DUF2235 domain-containing protein [Burkholderia sp. R-69608]CAE6962108.1 hypothetical protein R69608_06555 [Paraburkholderia nemoris]